MKWFHSHEYRHVLRSLGEYENYWKDKVTLKRSQSVRWWDRKYHQIFQAFQKAGLAPDGFSEAHTAIIEKILRFKPGALM